MGQNKLFKNTRHDDEKGHSHYVWRLNFAEIRRPRKQTPYVKKQKGDLDSPADEHLALPETRAASVPRDVEMEPSPLEPRTPEAEPEPTTRKASVTIRIPARKPSAAGSTAVNQSEAPIPDNISVLSGTSSGLPASSDITSAFAEVDPGGRGDMGVDGGVMVKAEPLLADERDRKRMASAEQTFPPRKKQKTIPAKMEVDREDKTAAIHGQLAKSTTIPTGGASAAGRAFQDVNGTTAHDHPPSGSATCARPVSPSFTRSLFGRATKQRKASASHSALSTSALADEIDKPGEDWSSALSILWGEDVFHPAPTAQTDGLKEQEPKVVRGLGEAGRVSIPVDLDDTQWAQLVSWARAPDPSRYG
jgi:hypothetical protein